MYRPNFCTECGARVERVRWRPWTSRRFCAGCERRFRRGRVAQPLVLCAAILGLGFALGRAGRPASPPLIVERGEMRALAPTAGAAQTQGAGSSEGAAGGINGVGEARYGPDGTAGERPTDPMEMVSICGARTKKGTPCSRRVRGTGRCWQHRGKPAMLPPEKLVIKN